MNINKKNIIRIPNDVSVFYCAKKKVMLIKGPKSKKFFKIDVKIIIKKIEKEILVSHESNTQKYRGNLKTIQGTTTALIKQYTYDTLANTYFKIMLIGVGYKALHGPESKNILKLITSDLKYKVFEFKLGFSHTLFFKIPESIKINCLKYTKLFIFGNSYFELTQTALSIRRKKSPEPYKGKGIRYENEKILLKEGKKA